jgi:hypothetical protein
MRMSKTILEDISHPLKILNIKIDSIKVNENAQNRKRAERLGNGYNNKLKLTSAAATAPLRMPKGYELPDSVPMTPIKNNRGEPVPISPGTLHKSIDGTSRGLGKVILNSINQKLEDDIQDQAPRKPTKTRDQSRSKKRRIYELFSFHTKFRSKKWLSNLPLLNSKNFPKLASMPVRWEKTEKKFKKVIFNPETKQTIHTITKKITNHKKNPTGFIKATNGAASVRLERLEENCSHNRDVIEKETAQQLYPCLAHGD